jgi:hypothetical protein
MFWDEFVALTSSIDGPHLVTKGLKALSSRVFSELFGRSTEAGLAVRG